VKKNLAVITTGPASSPIDDVRRITNFATGEIGEHLAESLFDRGFEVIVFRGQGATFPCSPKAVTRVDFTTNHDLARALEELSAARGNEVGAFFHSAALSDYSVTAIRVAGENLDRNGKIPGDLRDIHLVLEPAAKLLPRLRGWFPRAWIVGWKYEMEGSREDALDAGRTPLIAARTDATILNGAAYGPGFGFLEPENPPRNLPNKRQLADFLASRVPPSANPLKSSIPTPPIVNNSAPRNH
jgi:phosphopantothenate---cysteine ligase (CTP)